MSSSLNKKVIAKDSGYYALIHGHDDGFKVIVVDCATEEAKIHLSFECKNIKKFVKDFPKTFNLNYKVIIFNVFQCFNAANPNNIELCYKLKEQVEKLKIPYYFISGQMYLPSLVLAVTKFTCEPNDVIFIPLVCATHISSYAYRREANGYVNIRAVSLNENGNEKEYRDAFYGNFNPKKIIACSILPNSRMMNALRKIVPPQKLIVNEQQAYQQQVEALVEIAKWVLDPTLNNKCHFKPRSDRRFYASSTDKTTVQNAVIVIDYNEELPLTRKHLFPRTISQLHLTHSKDEPNPVLHFFKTCTPEAADCHQYELNFSIDNNNLPKAVIKNVMVPQIETLPMILDKSMKDRHPVIAFFDNSSVICFFNDKSEKYEFLESWNGVYGKDIFLNLKPEKPVLEYTSPVDNKSVITFTDICSFTESQPIPTLNDGLKLIKNATTQSTLEFERSDGTQGFSTPAFLMAFILREHYMAIKRKTGIKHEKLGIHYFKNIQERKKVEEGRNADPQYYWEFLSDMQTKHEIQILLKESCNMLRVQYSDEATKVMDNIGFSLMRDVL
uniref:Uncharacterized protein n=1 Tax=Panagrolaimus davidi TaxID=227884 RepID=A0A914QPC9_9BILA